MRKISRQPLHPRSAATVAAPVAAVRSSAFRGRARHGAAVLAAEGVAMACCRAASCALPHTAAPITACGVFTASHGARCSGHSIQRRPGPHTASAPMCRAPRHQVSRVAGPCLQAPWPPLPAKRARAPARTAQSVACRLTAAGPRLIKDSPGTSRGPGRPSGPHTARRLGNAARAHANGKFQQRTLSW